MPDVCKHCGCTNFVSDKQTGGLICMGCGAVAEEGRIVSELQFEEGSGGKTRMVGTFIRDLSLNTGMGGESGGEGGVGGGGAGGGFGMSSFERCVRRARTLMDGLSGRLKIPGYQVEEALRLYMLALRKKKTKGVNIEVTVAACLYIATRMEKTAHILLDFSDALGVNVAEIGAVYLKISKLLRQEDICLEDATILISRFVLLLSLPEKSVPVVSKVAKRVITLMDKAWITVGKPVLGILGASLFIGCRAANVHRTINEIAAAVHVSPSTIQKRLEEVKESNIGELKTGCLLGTEEVMMKTIDEFDKNVELPPQLNRSKEVENSIKEMMERLKESQEARKQVIEKAAEMTPIIEGVKHISAIKIPEAKELNLTDKPLLSLLCSTDETTLRQELWKIASAEAYKKAKITEKFRITHTKKMSAAQAHEKEEPLAQEHIYEAAYGADGNKFTAQSEAETDDLMQFLSMGSEAEFTDFNTISSTVQNQASQQNQRKQQQQQTQQQTEDEAEASSDSEKAALEMALFESV